MKYKIVNIVVSGDLGTQVNLEQLIKLSDFSYDPEYYHGGYLQLSNGLSVTIYRTGKYIIPGIKELNGIEKAFNELLTRLQDHIDVSNAKRPVIKNLVATGQLDGTVSLDELALKLRNVDYDPEQFPGLIIKIDKSLTVLLFSSGRFVIVGAKSIEDIDRAMQFLKNIQSVPRKNASQMIQF